MIGRFGGERSWRRRCGHCRSRLLFFEFHDPPADEQAVENNPDSDHEWDYSGQPHDAKDLPTVVGLLLRQKIEEEVEKDHHADADKAGNDAAFDLIEPSLFRRTALPLLYLLGEENIRRPTLAPII